MKRTLACLAAVVCVFSTAEAAVLNVPAGGNLQAALNAAQPGDHVVLESGATFVGQFVLPDKPFGPVITVRSSAPAPERRVTPLDAALMATIASPVGAMALDGYGAANWRIEFVRFEANPGGYGEVIGLWRSTHITMDRLLLVVPPRQEQKRGIRGDGVHITLQRSHLAGIWRSGQDSQAFAAWDGAGPYTITDNYLEAASENVIFGGADSTSEADVPADILVEGNHFSKPWEWKGTPKNVKNLFELKAAKRVVVRGNLFERNWVDGQSGYAILFTPRNQDGAAPWTVIEDVLFERNVVRDTPHIFNILGRDNLAPSRQTTRITIRHNLLLGDGTGRLALLTNEIGELTFDHNTYLQPHGQWSSMLAMAAEGSIAEPGGISRTPAYAVASFTFTNQTAQHNMYGVHSSNYAIGQATLDGMTRSYVWLHNLLAGATTTRYPGTTFYVSAEEYPTHFDANYLLVPESPYNGAGTDGTDLGWHGMVASTPTTEVPVDPTATEPDPTPEPTPEPEPPVVDSTPISIATLSVPDAVRNRAYAAQLSAEGADGPLTWSVSAGSLPPGLVLNASTGVIEGTPRGNGTFTFTIRVDEAASSASRTFTITIAGVKK